MGRREQLQAELQRRSDLRAELQRRSAVNQPKEQPAQENVQPQAIKQSQIPSDQMIPGQAPPRPEKPSFFEQQVVKPIKSAGKVIHEGVIAPAEAGITMAGGIAGEAVAGLAGLATLPFDDAEQAQNNINTVRDALAVVPPTKEGMAILKKVGEALQPAGETIEAARKQLGDTTLEATGSPLAASIAQTIPDALMAATGFRKPSLTGVEKTTIPDALMASIGAKVPKVAGVPKGEALFSKLSPAKQKIMDLINKGSQEKDVAKFKIKPQTKLQKAIGIGGPKIVKDKIATESIKQGFDEGVVAMVKGSSNADKVAMNKMVGIMEGVKKNSKFAAKHRPTDIAGNSLMSRFKVITDANKRAGKNIDRVAASLKGKKVNTESATNAFFKDMEDMGIIVDNKLNLKFKGSDIEGLTGPQRVIQGTFDRMKKTKTPDAFDVHRMKRFIDEQVSYGKSAEGLTGKSERILKKLRNNLDGTLDSNFPRYNKVNTIYSETIGVIDDLQGIAGKKMNLTGPNADKSAGTLLRGIMSNNKSRVNLIDALDDIEKLSKRHGGKFKDDLLTQILFADELDKVFKPVARTSLAGQVGQVVDRAAATLTPSALAVKAVGTAAEKVRGINEQGAFKAIKELLKDVK